MVRFLIIVCLVCSATSLFSAQRIDLYQDVVPVDSQGNADRNAAFMRALRRVITRVVGDPGKVRRAAVFSKIKDPSAYVESFSFLPNPDYVRYQEAIFEEGSENQTDEGEQSGPPMLQKIPSRVSSIPNEFLLEVTFSKQEVLRLVTEKQLPRWGEVRPSVMFWVAHEGPSTKNLWGTQNTQRKTVLFNQALERGIPIYLPNADEQDSALINTDALWMLSEASIIEAGKRYRRDLNLLLSLYQSSDENWHAKWKLPFDEFEETGELNNKSLDAIWIAVIDEVAKVLSKHYAVSDALTDSQSIYNLTLNNIDSYIAYITSQQALKAIPGVRAANLVRLKGSDAYYKISLSSSADQFLRQLELGQQFEPYALYERSKAVEEPLGLDVVSPAVDLPLKVSEQEDFTDGIFSWLGRR